MTMTTDSAMTLLGQTIKGYEIREDLGAGSFGVVYKAWQPAVGREVAIKMILPEYANQPEFIRRFEFEAQLVARLEHIHIVPLYDYWREPSGAYLVMRYLRGGSLRESLKNGPWELEPTARLVDQICSALAAAHRSSVVHRDLKPDNILLDEDGNAYLADFGIAKSLSVGEVEGEAVTGSPAYLSPEQIRGASVSAQADLYAMGIMIYEMLTGHAPLPNSSTFAEIVSFQLNESLPLIELAQASDRVVLAVNAMIQKATAKDPAERYPDALALARAFRDATRSGKKTGPLDTGQLDLIVLDLPDFDDSTTEVDLTTEVVNPFKGLRAFQQADADDFYGREALIEQIASRLKENGDLTRFLAVVGPSGSGKSSVVRAGLLPALRREIIPHSDRWFVVEMIPGPRPLDELEAALLRIAVNPPDAAVVSRLRSDTKALVTVVDHCLPDDPKCELLLVIDQFEEVFTLLDSEEERAHILNMLLNAVNDPASRVHIIVTLRADFYDRPLLYPRFGEVMRRRTEVVLPLNSDELRRAIVRPAQRVGISVDETLIAAIMEDVGEQPGALPLMQYALTELFERRKGRRLVLDAYKATGGVLGALARRADDLYKSLTPPQQQATQQLFLRLVTLGEGTEDTRRRVQRTELSALGKELDPVLDEFSKYRLLTFDRDPVTRDQTVEVAHEALIRTWTRLREWLNASREDLRAQRRLQQSAAEWAASKQDRSFLASGARLTQFEQLAQESTVVLNKEEADYLTASLSERDRRDAEEKARARRELETQKQAAQRLRYLVYVMTIFLLAGAALLAYAVRSQQEAETARTQAEVARSQAEASFTKAESQRIAALAANLLQGKSNAELAALLSLHSLNAVYTEQADAALRDASWYDFSQMVYRGSGAVNSVAFSPDGKYTAAAGGDKMARVWDRETGKLVQTFVGHADAIIGLAFSPDGKYLFTGSFDKTCRLWDITTGMEVRQYTGTQFRVRSVNYSPDGKYVVAGTGDWTAWMWDAATGEVVHQFGKDESMRHGDFILSVAFSPDSSILATASGDNSVRLWDVATGEPLRSANNRIIDLLGHKAFVESVRFSTDGKYLVTASDDKTVRRWNVSSGAMLQSFVGHEDIVYSADFSPDGKYIVTGSADKTARVWDVATGREVQKFANHTDIVRSVDWGTDDVVLTGSADGDARLWQVHTSMHPGIYTEPTQTSAVTSATMSPDGKLVMTGGEDKLARLWDADTGALLFVFTEHLATSGNIYDIAFSPDGKLILTGGDDGTARLIDAATGGELHNFQTYTRSKDWTGQVGFSPDGKLLLTSNKDGSTIVWDAATYRAVLTLTVDEGVGFDAAAFSPDGKTILTGSDDGAVILWDATSGKEMRRFEGHTDAVFRVGFSPDGITIVTGSDDRTIRLWTVATGKQIWERGEHGDQPWVVFSPDGTLVASGSYKGGAAIWEAATGSLRRVITGHAGRVRTLMFSPDGKWLLTGGNDSSARIQYVDVQDLMTAMCAKVTRDLTDSERRLYEIKDSAATCPAK